MTVSKAEFEEYERRKCAAKLSFETKKEAHQAKRALRRRYGATRHPYQCEWCGSWHLATKVPEPSNA